MMAKFRLVRDWRDWWRWHSTKALVLLGLLPTIWLEMPADMKAMIPGHWLQIVSFIVMLAGMLSRITKQKKPNNSTTPSNSESSDNTHQG
jgi:hypothetical protein